MDAFVSSDADHTDIAKLGLHLDWRRDGPYQYDGVRLEAARFRPSGGDVIEQVRGYYEVARKSPNWTWNGLAGTDGHTAIGSFDIYDEARFRQEYFGERGVVETALGLKRGVYYTFAGGSLDIPLGERNTFNVLGAAQYFTDENFRYHARVTVVHLLSENLGITAQLRARYFHSSETGTGYFSPEQYAQVMPVLQMRRFHAGWRYLVAAGLGTQYETGLGWRQARLVNAQLTSPPVGRRWAFDLSFFYSNTPISAAYSYDYRQVSVGLIRAF